MIAHQLALIRREVWEHRSIWVTPAAVALIMVLLTVASFVAASAFGGTVDMAIIGASNIGEAQRKAALIAFMIGNSVVFLIAMWFLSIFYCLDTLYAERKDKSILFWRSLPITDAETVTAKLLTAIILIPLVTFAAIAVTQIVNLVLVSIWLSVEGGSPGHIIWGSLTLPDTWLATLIVILAIPLWLSPLLGWFLFVSAWTKRGPFLTAFLPIAVVPLLEYVVFRTTMLWHAIGARFSIESMPLFNVDPSMFFDGDDFKPLQEDSISLLALIDVGEFLGSVELWLGLVVCGLFATAAIYVRRYRDDS